jgi:hypothetical protein
MAIRVRHTVVARTSRDTDFKKAMFNPEVDLAEVVLDTFEKQCNSNLSVAATTKEELSFGDVAAVKGIYLEVAAAAKVYINSSLDAIELVPGSSSHPAKLFLEANISKVEVENEAASGNLEGVYLVWGDPTP